MQALTFEEMKRNLQSRIKRRSNFIHKSESGDEFICRSLIGESAFKRIVEEQRVDKKLLAGLVRMSRSPWNVKRFFLL